MSFRKGGDAAQEAAKSQGGIWARTNWFSIDDEESIVLRFLTDHDDWITVDQHQNIKTKGKPDDFKGTSWPERMGAVCRRDSAFKGIFDDCYICEFLVDGKLVKKPSPRQWALACIREEVLGDGSEERGGPSMLGKRVGFTDAIREVKRTKDGKEETYDEKSIIVVNQGWKNFFGNLRGYAGMHGTILDRDYHIKRTGKSTDTTYTILPYDPIPGFDVRNPEIAKRYETDLDIEKLVTERASDEFYARFFDPRVSVTGDGKVESSGEAAAVAKPNNDVDEDEKLAALASRVTSYASGESSVPAASGMKDFG